METLLVIHALVLILCLNSVKTETYLDESRNPQCGKIFPDRQFVLISENYPLAYPPDKECFYLLKGGNCTTHFQIEFLDFNLRNSVGCTKDRLEIGSQDALCGLKNGSKVYMSEKGSLKVKFVSDNDTENGNRGFRLLVTRMDGCEQENSTIGDVFTVENRNMAEDTTEPVQFEWTTKIIPANPRPTYLPPSSQQCCQNNIFSSKTFLLLSPNFPYSANTPTDCIYVIRKVSSLVCRLRINILFFTLGPPTQNSCPYGHLEIDGKYICGCNSDVQLATNFRDSDSKILRFSSAGYRRNEASGFVLELIQDECQKRYSPEDGVLAEKATRKYRFYNDQLNRVQWPQNSDINQLKLVKERSYYIPPDVNEVDKQYGDVYKHIYFFAPEEEQDISWTQSNQEKEEINYIDVSTINSLLTNLYNYQQCIQWNNNQLLSLQRRFGTSLNEMCRSFQQNLNQGTNCVYLSSLYGSFSSPGFPAGYLANKNVCYRFQKWPGYCAVQIFFKDFQIERSYDCLKDYLTINQYRYCGNYLANKQVTISTSGTTHQDLNFVSDANYCGRGFSATYQQVRCQTPDDDSITGTNCNPEGKTLDENPINCGKVITDKFFIIRNEDGATVCTYDITRYSENICKVQLYFEHLNLPCSVGSISVNGRDFCGDRSGQLLNVDILDSITIIYRRNSRLGYTPNLGFLIRGEQVECGTLSPEPVRLISRKGKKIQSSSDSPNTIDPVISYPDICALIKENITTKELPQKICEMLSKYHNVTECNFSKVAVVDIPTPTANMTKIRLFNEESEAVNNYREIECQNR